MNGNNELGEAVHLNNGKGVIIFFYNENCPHSQNMVQPFIQLAKASPETKFYGLNTLSSKANYDVAKSYANVLPTIYSWRCKRGFGAFQGENLDSLSQLVSYIGSKEIVC